MATTALNRSKMKTQTRRALTAALLTPRAHRESASEHVRSALQLLEVLSEYGALDDEGRRDVRIVSRRLWLALGEIDRGNS